MHPDLDSWQRLGLADGIGPVLFRRLVTRFGSPERVLAASREELCALPNIDIRRAESILQASRTPLPSDWPARLERLGATILTYRDRSYPQRLLTIYDYPALMYLRGAITSRDKWAIAVVGSRRASPYGHRAVRVLVTELVGRGFTIVSGLARGIDSVAHRTALEAGGRTIAVLGSGIDVTYPPENSSLADQIAAAGSVVSEFPLGTRPEPGYFPRRNRIISGLSMGVLVVEAGHRSGALLTAHVAADQGREVFAVPGDIDRPTSQGPHHLIQEGAKLVHSVEDILEELPAPPEAARGHVVAIPTTDLTSAEQKLFHLLSDEPVLVDALIERTGLRPAQVLPMLLSLEIKGLVRQLSGKRFIRQQPLSR